MGLIEDELSEIKKLSEHLIPGSKLVSCVKTMVRFEIRKTEQKSLIVCIQFPENYPKEPILIELKSRTLSEKLLQKLTLKCEDEAKNYLGKPQILKVFLFLNKFMSENPLICCYDEITDIKSSLDNSEDELKPKQKTSSVSLRIVSGKYYLNGKITVPDNYPIEAIDLIETETNFPPAVDRHLRGQAKEIARQCVEPPLKKTPKDPPFKPVPSLKKSMAFVIQSVKKLPKENCQYCQQLAFPTNPEQVITDENSPRHIERIYCGHLYHQQCLFTYMKTPPFGNKTCHGCGVRISHHKWTLSDKLAEDRWSHEQARERELAEVEDFFK